MARAARIEATLRAIDVDVMIRWVDSEVLTKDNLHDALVDLRRTVGLGRVAWGLRAVLENGTVSLHPGCAFAPKA